MKYSFRECEVNSHDSVILQSWNFSTNFFNLLNTENNLSYVALDTRIVNTICTTLNESGTNVMV